LGEGVPAALLEVLSFVGLQFEDVADRSSGLLELKDRCARAAAAAAPRAPSMRRPAASGYSGEVLDHADYG
jgi:hypothetical protein